MKGVLIQFRRVFCNDELLRSEDVNLVTEISPSSTPAGKQ